MCLILHALKSIEVILILIAHIIWEYVKNISVPIFFAFQFNRSAIQLTFLLLKTYHVIKTNVLCQNLNLYSSQYLVIVDPQEFRSKPNKIKIFVDILVPKV